MDVDQFEASHFDRTLEEVRTVIGHAKLEEADLKPVSQVVSFTNQLFDETQMKLVQVTKEMASSLEAGDTLTLRGGENESAVLCYNNKTYDFKEAETSNSLLILPELSLDQRVGDNGERSLAWRTVSGVYYKYYELTEIRPRLHKLRDTLKILDEDMIRGGGDEELSGQTRSQLLDIIQASEDELDDGLAAIGAVKFRYNYFLLDLEVQTKALRHMVSFFDENSWSLDCVKRKETVSTLKSLMNEEILDQVFRLYCKPTEGGEEGCDDSFSVKTDSVCRLFGESLLSSQDCMDAQVFLHDWQSMVPPGLTTNIEQLSGLVFFDDNLIRWFPEFDLPNNIHDRLKLLFHNRDKWSVPEITPFIEPLTTPKLNVNAMLTKYARPVNVDGKKFFTAKHKK